MDDCLFCKMVSGEIKPDLVYETDQVIAFRDINPQAPLHALVIPRQYIATVNDAEPADAALLGQMVLAAQHIAQQEGYAESGFRLAMNCNADAGQTVFHIHLHLLAGRQLGWPPG
ncbi:MAG: histidine triad nucleotide-binding protein [Immundisolibacteraceae bacterium]|nr:histidine triad nucleotide-binding protein [Immundisolibacteraceae bacterium]